MKTVDFGICGAHKILLLFWEGRGETIKDFSGAKGRLIVSSMIMVQRGQGIYSGFCFYE